MRLRTNRLKQVNLKHKIIVKDSEGGSYESFSSSFISINAEIWPASSKLQSLTYGLKINNIMNMLYQGNEEISIGDGICYKVDSSNNPDYRVISKKEYTNHQLFELEKI